ncbi:hypothetical protein ACQEVB_23450 [Pseudonocardia sp. CA-107938]|uniref:hypothetical protein n=1 Tax=Pseudonocardia sp. CA-107938 TaxID=3240021 RepID=UPI003D912FFF
MQITDSTIRTVLLDLIGMFGLILTSIDWVLEISYAHAAIVVLLATVSTIAAELLANTTAAWFWKSLSGFVAAVLLESAMARVLVVGVDVLGQPSTIGGASRGRGPAAVDPLLVTLLRLLAAGATARSSISGSGSGCLTLLLSKARW